jgi:hypothetical protein
VDQQTQLKSAEAYYGLLIRGDFGSQQNRRAARGGPEEFALTALFCGWVATGELVVCGGLFRAAYDH